MDTTTSANSFKIRGTKVTLPYKPELTPAEVRLVFRLQRYFAPENIFPELYLPKFGWKNSITPTNMTLGSRPSSGSEITQIDCLALNENGLFVMESKDYLGYIFGTGSQKFWTQVTQYGQQKYRFYNPILQNSTHIRSLQNALGMDVPIFSLVVFGPDATLKDISDIPANCQVCKHAELTSTLAKFQYPRKLTPAEIAKIREQIIANRLIPTPTMRRDHASDIRENIN